MLSDMGPGGPIPLELIALTTTKWEDEGTRWLMLYVSPWIPLPATTHPIIKSSSLDNQNNAHLNQRQIRSIFNYLKLKICVLHLYTVCSSGGYFIWLLKKHKCLLVSNQRTDGCRSSPRDLVIRINTLPKGTSVSPWFWTQVTGLRDHCSTDWAMAPTCIVLSILNSTSVTPIHICHRKGDQKQVASMHIQIDHHYRYR